MKGKNIYFATVFNRLLENWKNENHMTQDDFSALTGIHRNSITKYKKGEAYPMDSAIQEICKTFNVAPSVFIPTTPAEKIAFDEEYRNAFINDLLDEELETIQASGIDIGFWKFFISIDNVYDLFPFEYQNQWTNDMVQGKKNSSGQKVGFTQKDLEFVKQLQHEAETTVSVLMIKELLKRKRKDDSQ